jgi:hypothetical protein
MDDTIVLPFEVKVDRLDLLQLLFYEEWMLRRNHDIRDFGRDKFLLHVRMVVDRVLSTCLG